MASSYAHVPLGSSLDPLQAKKNFSVSHLLDLEEAGEAVGAQAEDGVTEAGRSLMESPGLTSGSDTTQQESKCRQSVRKFKSLFLMKELKVFLHISLPELFTKHFCILLFLQIKGTQAAFGNPKLRRRFTAGNNLKS